MPEILETGYPRKLGRGDEKGVVGFAARAFLGDPLYLAAAPDPEKRLKLTACLARIFFRYALKWGLAEGIGENIRAAALWLPPDEKDLNTFKLILCGAWKIPFIMSQAGLKVFLAVDKLATKIHAEDCPGKAWYLLFIATDPNFSGKGHAARLLESRLGKIDAEKFPVYLETQNPHNVDYYKKFGFAAKSSHRVPGTDVDHFSMLRNCKE